MCRLGSLLSQVSDHPSDEDLSLEAPVKTQTWGTQLWMTAGGLGSWFPTQAELGWGTQVLAD